MQAINVAKYYFSGLKRNPYRIFGLFFIPVIDIVLYYYLVISIDTNFINQSLVYAFTTSIVFWTFFSKMTSSISGEFIDDATSKSIRSLIISPLKIYDLAFGLFLSAFIKILVVAVLSLIVVNALVGSFVITTQAFLWFVVLVVFGWAIGLVIAGAVFVLGERVGVLGMYVNLLVQPFSCVFFSRDVLPQPLKFISYLFPSSYVFESIRVYVHTGEEQSVLFALILALVMLILAFILFGLFFKLSKKTGMITKI